jgi:F-box/WD-40 domain protein MET30
VYKDRFKVGTNWKYGRCSIKVLKGHNNGIMALQMIDNILATGSYDATIKIWNMDTGEEVRTLVGHTMGIRCLQFDDTKLISGSLDRTLKVWNWRTGECLSTYSGHSDGVISLHFDSNLLASGSSDNTARIWNFQDRSVFCLRGHTDWINAVRVDSASRTVFTASDDCTIKLWDLDTKKCVRTYEGHVGHVQQVVIMPPEFDVDEAEATSESSASEREDLAEQQGTVESVSSGAEDETELFSSQPSRPKPPRYMLTSALDATIRLWEVATGRCIRTYFGHVEGVWALAADNLRIVSGAHDRTVKVWDPRSGKSDKTFAGHAGPVTCIGLSDGKMCSGGEDGEVRVYNFTDRSG